MIGDSYRELTGRVMPRHLSTDLGKAQAASRSPADDADRPTAGAGGGALSGRLGFPPGGGMGLPLSRASSAAATRGETHRAGHLVKFKLKAPLGSVLSV
mgnify:CR=1 FL=1